MSRAVSTRAEPKKQTTGTPWYASGLGACCASLCTHPLDLAKVRMQVSGTGKQSMGKTLAASVRADGLRRGAYAGLSASLLRQMTYSTARFGAYPPILASLGTGSDPKRPGIVKLLIASSAAGVVGGVAGNPADIVLVRMTSDRNKPPDKRVNYRNCFDGVWRILKDEGVAALFRGLAPNCGRAVLMNASQIATYDTFKRRLLATKSLDLRDGLLVHTLASSAAGTVATTACSPFDVLKSRIMNAKGNESMVQVARASFAQDGIVWLFRGWTPAWLRLTPQTVVTFVAMEQIKRIFIYLQS